MELAKAVYQMTATFPAEERYGLFQEMRCAAVSIPREALINSLLHSVGVQNTRNLGDRHLEL
jgi:hypothetical protein